MSETVTIKLARGYIDPEGKAHREVVLRAPLIDDEIKADAARSIRGMSAPGEGESDALWELYLFRECIVSLGAIRQLDVDLHLRTLSRADSRRLSAGVAMLEASLEAVELEEGKSDGEPTSSP